MLPKRAIICASGNSIQEGLDKGLLSILENECSFIINFNHHYMKGTVNVCCDWEFYSQEKPYLDKLGLVVAKLDQQLIARNIVGNNTILCTPSGYYHGKASIKKGIYSGALTGLFNLTLAIALEFEEIYLLGYDFCEINGKTHFFQDNKEGIGIVRKEAGEPGQFMNTTGIGREPSDPTLYKTGCYNDKPERLYNVYHPTEFLEINLNENDWKAMLVDIQTNKKKVFNIFLEQYLSEEEWRFIKKISQSQKERQDYIDYHEYKKFVIIAINKMIKDFGINKVSNIFHPYLREFHDLKKELQYIKIYNVSPQSKIETFPKLTYDEFFEKLKNNPIKIDQEKARQTIKKEILERQHE